MHVSHITNWSTYNWLFPSDFWPFTNITNELKEKGQKPTLHWTMGPPLTSWKLPLALVKGNRGSMKSYDCQKLHDVSHTGNDLISLKIAQITNYSKSSPIIALRRIWPNCIRPRIQPLIVAFHGNISILPAKIWSSPLLRFRFCSISGQNL